MRNVFLVHCEPDNTVELQLNALADLSIVFDHGHLFMATVYWLIPAFYCNVLCSKAQVISNWFYDHDNEFNVLQQSPQSPAGNPSLKCDIVSESQGNVSGTW